MKKTQKSILMSMGGLVVAGAIATPVAIVVTSNSNNSNNNQQLNPNITYNENLSTIEGNKPEQVQTTASEKQISFKVESLEAIEESYKITIINNDEYGTITFEDNSNEYVAKPGELVKLKVQLKDEYKDTHTIVNLEVYDEVNPNYSLGVKKIDDNNYEFTMPEGGEDGKWFYQTGKIFAKVTYGLQKLGKWEFDFKSKHYIFNVTEDNFVYDDEANPELKMQKYPSGSFVVYRIQLNGHNIKIKNMTIPKNVQFEICNTYEDGNVTTENSPVVGFVRGGKLDQQGAAGIWRGVRATWLASSEFNWGLGSYASPEYDG
ncbi:MAG: hypothetical protein HDR43_02500 [Mycoplasma sp.]|nr:hypothetical protein [Mycoplasma sp.]